MKNLKWLKQNIKLMLPKYRSIGNFEIDWAEVEEKRKNNNAILVDVRSTQEYEEGHIQGAICIPSYELKYKASKILKDKTQTIILYCQTGDRSAKGFKILRNLGYTNVYNVEKGLAN